MTTRRDFAGGDQGYLRHVQYVDPSKLAARSRLHLEASTSPIPWFDWLAAQVTWPETGTVVEAGCGPGWFWANAEPAPPSGLRLILTDQSAGMATEARRHAGARFPAVSAAIADVQSLPVAASAAQVVVANHMLYHAPSPERGVTELARVLDPDGTALISTNGAAHLHELTSIVVDVFPDAEDTMSFVVSTFGRQTGEPMLRRHFADVEWRPFADELVCGDPDVVLGYLTSFPPGEQAGDAEHAALRAAVERAFAAGDGTMRITKDTGAFVARAPGQSRAW